MHSRPPDPNPQMWTLVSRDRSQRPGCSVSEGLQPSCCTPCSPGCPPVAAALPGEPQGPGAAKPPAQLYVLPRGLFHRNTSVCGLQSAVPRQGTPSAIQEPSDFHVSEPHVSLIGPSGSSCCSLCTGNVLHCLCSSVSLSEPWRVCVLSWLCLCQRLSGDASLPGLSGHNCTPVTAFVSAHLRVVSAAALLARLVFGVCFCA